MTRKLEGQIFTKKQTRRVDSANHICFPLSKRFLFSLLSLSSPSHYTILPSPSTTSRNQRGRCNIPQLNNRKITPSNRLSQRPVSPPVKVLKEAQENRGYTQCHIQDQFLYYLLFCFFFSPSAVFLQYPFPIRKALDFTINTKIPRSSEVRK